jgi:hypothetical protein
VLLGLQRPVVFAFSANTQNVNICCLLVSFLVRWNDVVLCYVGDFRKADENGGT